MHYAKSTNAFYNRLINQLIPGDAVEVTNEQYRSLIDGLSQGMTIATDATGSLCLIDRPLHIPTKDELCQQIDTAADTVRSAVAGDPLRAVEYDRARIAAEQYAAAGYQGVVPAMVAAWAINGRTPRQAADSILAEAAAYTGALELLRTTRLAAKEQVRTLMDSGEVEQAQLLTEQTIAEIEEAVVGLGNNA